MFIGNTHDGTVCKINDGQHLLKILDPHSFVRDRPDRASPRATKKAGDFPARKDRPTVVRVHRRLQIHCLRPNSPLLIT
jgi:hypothetical protein